MHLAERCSNVSLGSFNRAGVKVSLTLRDASSGLQPAMSTDTCALRKDRLKYETLDRRSEETLDFNIQIEKPIFKEASQSRAYTGLARRS